MTELNLLDIRRKSLLEERVRTHRAMNLLAGLIVLITIQTAGLYYLQTRLQQHAQKVNQRLAKTQVVSPTGKTLPIRDVTKRINSRLAIMKSWPDAPLLDSVLLQLTTDMPAGVTFTSLAISAKTLQLDAQGIAKGRNDIPMLQKYLDQLTFLKDVKTQSNINERTDVPFSVHATLLPITVQPAP